MQLSFDADVEAFRAEFVAFLDEHLPDESETVQRSRSSSDVPPWARRWQRLLRQHQMDRLERRHSAVGRPAGQRFVQQHTQGVDIRGWPHLVGASARLLGGHVPWRAHDLTGNGQAARVVDSPG